MIQAELDAIRRVAAVHYKGGPALDVGASSLAFRQREKLPYDLSGLFEPGAYRTFDIKPAVGVDIVGDVARLTEYVQRESVSFVICTNLLEHCPDPWVAAWQCAWVLRKGGIGVFSVPWSYMEHPDPEDHWRINLSGLRLICEPYFDEVESLRLVEPGIATSFFVGRRRA